VQHRVNVGEHIFGRDALRQAEGFVRGYAESACEFGQKLRIEIGTADVRGEGVVLFARFATCFDCVGFEPEWKVTVDVVGAGSLVATDVLRYEHSPIFFRLTWDYQREVLPIEQMSH